MKSDAEPDVMAVMRDPQAATLQFRLTDRFGDNGIIAIIIGRPAAENDLVLDTWLMSCRVLGRQVEESTLNVVACCTRSRGIRYLIGEYRPTAKNGIVRDHYRKLGFELLEEDRSGGSRWRLNLATFETKPTSIRILQG